MPETFKKRLRSVGMLYGGAVISILLRVLIRYVMNPYISTGTMTSTKYIVALVSVGLYWIFTAIAILLTLSIILMPAGEFVLARCKSKEKEKP
ncbi:MAG: hypothetical protein ACTSUE_25250 [Promethearchaeota archaeon]